MGMSSVFTMSEAAEGRRTFRIQHADCGRKDLRLSPLAAMQAKAVTGSQRPTSTNARHLPWLETVEGLDYTRSVRLKRLPVVDHSLAVVPKSGMVSGVCGTKRPGR